MQQNDKYIENKEEFPKSNSIIGVKKQHQFMS